VAINPIHDLIIAGGAGCIDSPPPVCPDAEFPERWGPVTDWLLETGFVLFSAMKEKTFQN
jgi:hypothetical protein